MADISKITATDGTTYDLKDASARSDVAALSGRFLHNGAITNAALPKSFALTNLRAYLLTMTAYGSTSPTNDAFVTYLVTTGGSSSGSVKWFELASGGSNADTYIKNRVTLSSEGLTLTASQTEGASNPFIVLSLTQL